MISQSAQLCGSPLQHYSHWTSGASQIVSVCLFWFHLVVFGFMQAPLWTAASETPFCPSEFCILAGVLLHLVSLFAIHQWRESKENQGLSFTRLACFFLSQYFTTPHTLLLSSTWIPFLHLFPHSLSSQNPSYVQPTVYSQMYGLLFFNYCCTTRTHNLLCLFGVVWVYVCEGQCVGVCVCVYVHVCLCVFRIDCVP